MGEKKSQVERSTKSYHLKCVKISSKTTCKNMGKDMKTGNSQKSKSEWPAYTLKDVRFISSQCKKKKLKSSNEVLHPAKIQVQWMPPTDKNSGESNSNYGMKCQLYSLSGKPCSNI